MVRASRQFAGMVAAVTLVSGCGFTFPPEPQPEPTAGPEAYRIGILDGPLADELEEGMQLVPHTGTLSDKPIVIAAEALDTITADQTSALNTAYAGHRPIILVYAGLEDILALQRLLGNDSFEYDLPGGVPYAEIYAVDKEADGSMWQWSLFPPENMGTEYSETTTVNSADGTEESSQTPESVSLGYDDDEKQDSRADVLIQWVAEDEQRMQAPAAQTARLQVTQAGGPKDELTEIGEAWIDQWNFQQSGNNYQIAHFAWRVHSITNNQDWFYVQQKCIFSASTAFTTNVRRQKAWYLSSVEMDASIAAFDNKPAVVGLIQSSPQTANNETQVTSGVSWSIGGEVAVDQNGPSAKLNGGVTISNSTTVNVRDCNVLDKSNDRGNNPHWIYQFKRSEVSGAFDDYLSAPPNLAITTFQPMNQWIWRMSPEARSRNAPMLATCSVTLENTDETWGFFYYKLKRSYQSVRQARMIHIPYPATQ